MFSRSVACVALPLTVIPFHGHLVWGVRAAALSGWSSFSLLFGGVPRVVSRSFFSRLAGLLRCVLGLACFSPCSFGFPSGSSVRPLVPFPSPSSFRLGRSSLPALPLVALGFGFVGAVVAASFGRACSCCRRGGFGCRAVVLAVRLPPLWAGLTPRPHGRSHNQKHKKRK